MYSVAERFYRHVPVVMLDPATLGQLKRFGLLVDRRWVRRATAALIIFTLAALLATWMDTAHRHHVRYLVEDDLLSRIVMFTTAASGSFTVGMALFFCKGSYRLAGSSTDDPGLTEYGIPYHRLTLAQRRSLAERNRTDWLRSRFYPDERQIAEQERAERTAWGLLKRAAILMVVAIWALYLIAPEGALGRLLQSAEVLLCSPLVLTWMVIALIALPTLIRLWNEPDQAEEPRLVVDAEKGA
jgi:hypothetical protein